MFPIHYVDAQGRVVGKETSEATQLEVAISGAQNRRSSHQGAVGFEIFNADGTGPIYRGH